MNADCTNPISIPVVMAKGIHLFPYRTQKLSLSAPMVLGWRRPGRVGHCRIPNKKDTHVGVFFICPVSFLLSRALSQVQHCTWLGCPRAASSGRREARGQCPGALHAEWLERLANVGLFYLSRQRPAFPGSLGKSGWTCNRKNLEAGRIFYGKNRNND